MVWQRSRWLSMVAVGSPGTDVLADGSAMQRGVHLRWQIGSDLGFPPGGFDVYRRGYSQFAGEKKCVEFSNWSGRTAPPFEWMGYTFSVSAAPRKGSGTCGSALVLPGTQTLEITPPSPAREAEITGDGAGEPPVATALATTGRQENIVAQSRAVLSGGNWVANLYADRIDKIRLEGKDMKVCKICTLSVKDRLTDDWGSPLNGKTHIYLPITHPDWPGVHAHTPNDQAEAEARLPSGLSADVFARYAGGFRDDLHDILYALVGTDDQETYSIDEAGTPSSGSSSQPAPRLTWGGLQLLSLISLDPNLARILGLYWCDSTAVRGQLYDYRVVGHWDSSAYPGTHITFASQREGRSFQNTATQDGLEVFTPLPMRVVKDSWSGQDMLALRISAQAFTAPVWMRLSKSCPSVTFNIKTSTGFSITAYLNGTAVGPAVTEAGGEKEVLLEDTGGMNQFRIEATSPLYLFEVITRPVAGSVGDLNYVVFRQGTDISNAVRPTTLDTPKALRGRSTLQTDGSVMDAQNAIGLRWDISSAGKRYLMPGAPIFYHVRRGDRGSGQHPSSTATSTTILNEQRPALVSKSMQSVNQRPAGWPTRTFHYIDQSLADGWYEYSVRGIDLFGRLSAWSSSQLVQALDRVAPPPPISVRAVYLDASDSWLSEDDRAWAESNGAGLKMTWEWPGIRRIQAPDVDESNRSEFRVYSVEGPLNTLRGQITAVSDSGSTSELTTDQTWDGLADDLAEESIRVGNTYFKITGNTTGPNFKIAVNNLTNPTEVPQEGLFVVAYSKSGSHWTDYRKTTAWEKRIHVEPVQDVPTIMGTIAAVSSSGDTCEVTTDQNLDEDSTLTAGVFVSNGVVYRAVEHQTGDPLKVTVNVREMPSDTAPTAEPRSGDSFVYYPSRTYTVYVSGFSLTPADGEGTAMANLTVSTSDGKKFVSDLPIWSSADRGGLGGRHGNEGPPGPPCKVLVPRRTTLSATGATAAGEEPIYAQPANYYGEAKYTLSWAAVSGAEGYAVYRCSGQALFTVDKEQRRLKKGYYEAEGTSFEDDSEFSSWLSENYSDLTESDLYADLESGGLSAEKIESILAAWREWSERFYSGLSDSEIQSLANRDGNEAALRRVNTELEESTSYTDTFDGRGAGLYLWRIRAVDASGNFGEWSDTLVPIHIYDVTPPAMPIFTSILSGENSVTLSWRSNAESDLAEYRLWCSTTEDDLEDVRRVDPTATITPTAGASTETYTDEDLTGAATYYYRLAAVDTNGNVSEPTPPRSVRPYDTSPPDPPAWDAVTRSADGTGGTLSWTCGEELQCLVKRQTDGTSSAIRISGWLAADSHDEDNGVWRYSLEDDGLSADTAYTYSITGRGANGLTSESEERELSA